MILPFSPKTVLYKPCFLRNLRHTRTYGVFWIPCIWGVWVFNVETSWAESYNSLYSLPPFLQAARKQESSILTMWGPSAYIFEITLQKKGDMFVSLLKPCIYKNIIEYFHVFFVVEIDVIKAQRVDKLYVYFWSVECLPTCSVCAKYLLRLGVYYIPPFFLSHSLSLQRNYSSLEDCLWEMVNGGFGGWSFWKPARKKRIVVGNKPGAELRCERELISCVYVV